MEDTTKLAGHYELLDHLYFNLLGAPLHVTATTVPITSADAWLHRLGHGESPKSFEIHGSTFSSLVVLLTGTVDHMNVGVPVVLFA